MQELEQCVRRAMLTEECTANDAMAMTGVDRIAAGIEHERFTAEELMAEYCRYLFGRHGVYTDVARITGLNWRTVRGAFGHGDGEDSRAEIASLHRVTGVIS